MAGYPPSGYGYGAPPPGAPYGNPAAPHGLQPPNPYGNPAAPYGQQPPNPYAQAAPSPYGAPSAPYASGPAAGVKPPKGEKLQQGQAGGQGYPPAPAFGNPFASLMPSAFAPGTDPNIIACFKFADQDGSGFIDDKELQRSLSSYNQGEFSMRTVRLLMYLFTNSSARKIGPKEFTSLFYSLQNWRANFERFDRDRSGRIDALELREALLSLGYSVSPVIVDLLVSKFDKAGGKNKAIEYDNFIECCLTVKGLTEKFKEKDTGFSGSATFTYESFMLTVLPFLVA